MNYFIYGNEGYLLKQELRKIIKSDDSTDHLSVVYYDGMAADFDIERIIEDANMISLFGDSKVVVVNNPSFLFNVTLSDDQVDRLSAYLHDSSDFTTLIFYVELTEQETIDQRRKIFKLLAKECQTIKVNALTPEAFENLVMKDLKMHKVVIDQDGFKELIARLPNSIANWKTELDKLILYNSRLGKTEIQRLIARSLDDNVFIMVNAVVKRNLKLAIDAWRDLAIMKHDPIELVAILAAQFRFMYQCSVLARKYDNQQIADMLNAKIARVNITLGNCRFTSPTRILGLLAELSKLDQNIKGGIIEKQLGFELFLIEATR